MPLEIRDPFWINKTSNLSNYCMYNNNNNNNFYYLFLLNFCWDYRLLLFKAQRILKRLLECNVKYYIDWKNIWLIASQTSTLIIIKIITHRTFTLNNDTYFKFDKVILKQYESYCTNFIYSTNCPYKCTVILVFSSTDDHDVSSQIHTVVIYIIT